MDDPRYEEYLADLRSGGVLGEIDPEVATRAVLGAFLRRVSGKEAARLVVELPAGLRALLRDLSPPVDLDAAHFSRDELTRKVASALTVEEPEAEAIVRTVLAAIRVQCSEERAGYLAGQLPADLRDVWLHPGVPPLLPPEDLGDARLDEMLEDVRRSLDCDEAFAWSALAETLCALEHRLSGGEARHLFEELPWRLRQVIRGCRPARADAAPRMGVRSFVEHLEARLGVDHRRAEHAILAVCGAVRQHISEEAARDVSAQLPMELKKIWWGKVAPRARGHAARVTPPVEERPPARGTLRALFLVAAGSAAERLLRTLQALATLRPAER